MEIHSVLPEERARDEKGETLPWGYRYADSSRNTRQPEESGPFGRNRSLRHTNSRASRTRTGTTPVRQKENTAVADFARLFTKEQARDDDERSKRTLPSTAGSGDAPLSQPDNVATECVLYGYANKNAEWKVLSKYEKIVAPAIICEDYPRDDPNLLMTNLPSGFSKSSVLLQRSLSRDAMRKSRVYRGGFHWIKVTFDSYQGAERACHFSPVEIDGCMVFCEMWTGKPPVTDLPIPKGTEPGLSITRTESRTMGPAHTAQFAKDSALLAFERAMQTLPRSHTLPDVQYAQPHEDGSITSTTASSATAHEAPTPTLRSRSIPNLPSQITQDPTSQYMTHIPSVKKAVLRPISEALPPQPTFAEKVLRSLPIVSWFVGRKGASGDMIGEGPLLKEDGNWDERNGWYWSFWYSIDRVLGTDFCGLKDD